MSITALPVRVHDDGPATLAFTVVLPNDAPIGTANRVLEEVSQLIARYQGRTPLRAVPDPKGPAAAPPAAAPSVVVVAGSREVRLDGRPVAMTRREFDLLLFLARHPRRVFTRAQLLHQVWGYDMIGGERTVDVHVRRLRGKLGPAAHCIATVRGVGYRLDDDRRGRVDVRDC